jgi:heat shock protein HtpX
MKRIVLFVLTNLAVMFVLGLVVNIFGLNRFLTENGLNLGQLLVFAAVMGFGGAIISLLMSKPMAKWSTKAQVINDSPDPTHQWIVGTVRRFADKAGIQMPEVAIYDGEPNAFATGAFKNSALVAVSTGLLQGMNRQEVEAVIGHEVAHVANGDMVTMTLIQGVMNTFVVFLSRVIGHLVDSFLRRGDSRGGPGIGYYATTIVLDIVLGVLAAIIVAWFYRPPGRPAARRTAEVGAGAGHHRHPERLCALVLEPPADRGADRRTPTAPVSARSGQRRAAPKRPARASPRGTARAASEGSSVSARP